MRAHCTLSSPADNHRDAAGIRFDVCDAGWLLQVDVYAFAMIAFELFEGWIPFQRLHPVEAARMAAVDEHRPSFKPQNRYARPPHLVMTASLCGSHQGRQGSTLAANQRQPPVGTVGVQVRLGV